MVLLLVLALVMVWTPYVVMRLLRTQHPRTSGTGHLRLARAEPPSWTAPPTDSQDVPLWSALDDRQLTRLLTDSAPRTNTE